MGRTFGPNTTSRSAPIFWHKTSSGVAMAKAMVATIDVETTINKVYFASSGAIAPDDTNYSTFILTLHDGAGDTVLVSFATTIANLYDGDGVTVGYWESAANPVNLALAAPVTITPDATRPATISLTISQSGSGASIPAGMLHLQCTRPQ